MKTSLLTGISVLFCLLYAEETHAQTPATNGTADTTVVTFKFLPGEDMFYIPWADNGAELERLYALADEYRAEIASGAMPLYVDGYCASLPTVKENLHTAFVRANRVKSELILHKGLTEMNFITANYARAYHNNKDVVVVTLRIPVKERPDTARIERERREQAERERQAQAAERERMERERRERAETERAERERAEAERLAREQAGADAVQRHTTESAEPAKPYHVAVRTNVLYDAMLLPTLGIEWRVNRDLGIKLDGSRSWWGGSAGKVQKIWLVSPEVRWYLLNGKRFYAGVSGSYGEYNIYGYPLGNLMKDDTGYQGSLWNAGLTVGYQLRISRLFSVDFNLGLGYTRSEYDSFLMTDGVRVYKQRNQSKNFWGPTQAGISFMWTIGGKNK